MYMEKLEGRMREKVLVYKLRREALLTVLRETADSRHADLPSLASRTMSKQMSVI